VALAPGRAFFAGFLVLQVVCYAASFAGWSVARLGGTLGPLFAPYYFLLLNLGSAHAFLLFAMGRKRSVWTPRKG